jgi:ketosteroid isomerase-like protein
MALETRTRFDIEVYKRAYEQWDVETLLSLYADDVEQIQMDDATPPREPGTYRGKERLEQMFRHCKENGVKATVENPVPGDERAAATVTCAFPTGRKVVANVILDLRDGRIARELVTAARDAE